MMPRTLLVTTDLSTNSKAGIRFAIQLAAQAKYSLVFYHCLPYLKPTRWSDAQYDAYARRESDKASRDLEQFIQGVFRSSRMRRPRFECVVHQSADVVRSIIDHAVKIGATAICMSTRGAGRLRKFLGTHASGIIEGSPVPVFVVPKNYRRNRIKHIFYSSDLNSIAPELKQVRDLAKPLSAKVSVVHYDYLADIEETRQKLEKVVQRYKYPNVDFRFKKYNVDKTLAQHLLKDTRASRASLIVLFTNQKRGWFDKLFLSSKSAELAYDSNIPLLIFPKG